MSTTTVRKFKKGDRVLYNGKERVIRGECFVSYSGECYDLEPGRVGDHAYAYALTPAPKFKVGDRVRITGGHGGAEWRRGTVGRITEVVPCTIDGTDAYQVDGPGSHYVARELELIPEDKPAKGDEVEVVLKGTVVNAGSNGDFVVGKNYIEPDLPHVKSVTVTKKAEPPKPKPKRGDVLRAGRRSGGLDGCLYGYQSGGKFRYITIDGVLGNSVRTLDELGDYTIVGNLYDLITR